MNATALVRQKHRALERLLSSLGQDKPQRLTLVLQLIEELFTHLSVEEHLFLCSVADATGIRVDRYREHQAMIRNAMLQAVFAESDDETFAPRLRELVTAFADHSRGLEHDLFPFVESRLRADQLEAIGERMQAFWSTPRGGARPSRPAPLQAAE